MNYMILCDAMQYVTWSWYRLVMTASAKIGLRLLTFCSSLSTRYCWWVLHNPSACSQLSYQQAFMVGTSQFRVSLSSGYIFIRILWRLILHCITMNHTIQYRFRISKNINSIII